MIAECVRDFRDKVTGELRTAGDRFEVDSERFAALNATRYGTLVVEVAGATERPAEVSGGQTPTEAKPAPKRATRGRRKTTKE